MGSTVDTTRLPLQLRMAWNGERDILRFNDRSRLIARYPVALLMNLGICKLHAEHRTLSMR